MPVGIRIETKRGGTQIDRELRGVDVREGRPLELGTPGIMLPVDVRDIQLGAGVSKTGGLGGAGALWSGVKGALTKVNAGALAGRDSLATRLASFTGIKETTAQGLVTSAVSALMVLGPWLVTGEAESGMIGALPFGLGRVSTPADVLARGGLEVVGMTVPPPEVPQISVVNGHEVVAIPGGLSVIGSAGFQDAPPRWSYNPPLQMFRRDVSEGQYREKIGKAGREGVPEDHPVACVSHASAVKYLSMVGSRLPSETEWEPAARGPAVNIRAMMQELGIPVVPRRIAAFIEGRFENLVFGVLGPVFNNPQDEAFQSALASGQSFYGWRQYATLSGRLTAEEVWYDRQGTTDVDFGPANAYELKQMVGNVWRWMADWYSATSYLLGGIRPIGPETGDFKVLRGGRGSGPDGLRASFRYGDRPADGDYDVGFRGVVSSQHSPMESPAFKPESLFSRKPKREFEGSPDRPPWSFSF